MPRNAAGENIGRELSGEDHRATGIVNAECPRQGATKMPIFQAKHAGVTHVAIVWPRHTPMTGNGTAARICKHVGP
ncbi:hypothetical protein D3C77_558760 [compost metagenome]